MGFGDAFTVLRERLAARKDSEHNQALLRLAIMLVGGTAYGWSLFGRGVISEAVLAFIVGTQLCSLALFLHIVWRPEPNPIRRIVGAIHDNLGSAIFLFYAGLDGAFWFFVFPFVAIGNGFRFGVPYLAFSGALGSLGLGAVVLGSPAWAELRVVGAGLLLSNVVVMIYNGVLLQKLQWAQRRLEDLASRDPLTGLVNRRVFSESLAHSLALARRHRQTLACAYFDLDGFKLVNDRFGHQIGDALLKAVAEKVRQTVRQTDLIARLGGDEFAIILERPCGPDETRLIGERLVRAIESLREVEGHGIQVSASVGCAHVGVDGGREGLNAAEFLREADEAMYRAKKGGKGRVEFISMTAEPARRSA